jgi:hypothetical protein
VYGRQENKEKEWWKKLSMCNYLSALYDILHLIVSDFHASIGCFHLKNPYANINQQHGKKQELTFKARPGHHPSHASFCFPSKHKSLVPFGSKYSQCR